MDDECLLCETPIAPDDEWRFMNAAFFVTDNVVDFKLQKVHRECGLRDVMGGIGHLVDHDFWCTTLGDPDGGRTYRQSALEVDAWIREHGTPA